MQDGSSDKYRVGYRVGINTGMYRGMDRKIDRDKGKGSLGYWKRY
jgi:hypothetical protein